MISTQSQTINFNQPTTPSDSPPGSPPGNPPGLNQIHTEENSQYSMLHNEDDDNPFAKCKIDKLDYDTDSEQTDHIRIIFTWNYEFNYEYFSLKNTYIFFSKDDLFNTQLDELKKIRNTNTCNTTGKIYK